MRMRPLVWLLLLGLGGGAVGCSSERGTEERTSPAASGPDTLVIETPWVRPGSREGMSALYFRIENGTDTADTLQAVRADAADTVEIHEAYESEDGMRGMRPVGPVPVPAGEQVAFVPGGLHVMLIQLNRALEAGDSLAVELEFAQAGARLIHAPVRMQPPTAP